ncbi:MAG: hypothetical protein HY885_07415 [Deltaproteobacteria bacterium]|nr:hypothetical protein [Deltaproteobacteria bacterium]
MATKQRLGELLIEKGLITQNVVDDALRVQVSGNRRLGTILVKMGWITDEQLLDVLSKQQGEPRVNIEKEFDPDVKNILPKYLCQKYGLLPLSIEKTKKVLKIAMVDPLDEVAINDVENYTGYAVWGLPAPTKEIEQAISKLIPFSVKDIFNPQTYNTFTKIASVVALVLALVTISFIYNFFEREKYGVISQQENQTIYRNHDLIVSFEKEGKISLLGHGAYAEGYYAVLFNDKDSFLRFTENKKDKFSEKQIKWLNWVSQQNPLKTN